MANAPTIAAPSGGYQNGGWYGGQQYWNGTWSNPGQINSQSNQQGAGQMVSDAVNAQSAKAQGVSTQQFNSYLQQQQQNPQNTPNTPMPTGAGGSGGGLGIGSGSGQPTLDLQSVYDKAYNTPEMKAAQDNINQIDQQVNDRRTALNTAMNNINDNPFYAEATRVGKGARLQSEADQDINTYLAQKQDAVDNLTRLQSDADRQVNIATGQYNIQNQQYQQTMQNFNTLLGSGAFVNANSQDLANLSSQTGISYSMLSSIQQTQQKAQVKPQIVTSTDSNGNLTIAAIDASTGKLINQETLSGVGKGSGGGSTSTAKNLTQSFQNAANTTAGKSVNGTWVGTFPQLVSQFAPSMSLKEIYQNYANTGIGKKYGQPKESAADIQQIYNYYKTGTQ